MTKFAPRKSSPRLREFSYQGSYAHMLTINTRAGLPFFTDAMVVRECQDSLARAADQHRFQVLAYCFMPDHLHLLVQGSSEASKLVPFIQQFKQLTGFRFKVDYGQPLWQRSFYDHVLRSEEDLGQVAEYIWNNPRQSGSGNKPGGVSVFGSSWTRWTDLKVCPYV